jgi:hypothetical protein
VDRSKKSFDEAGKPHDKEALIDRLIDWLYNPQETKVRAQLNVLRVNGVHAPTWSDVCWFCLSAR